MTETNEEDENKTIALCQQCATGHFSIEDYDLCVYEFCGSCEETLKLPNEPYTFSCGKENVVRYYLDDYNNQKITKFPEDTGTYTNRDAIKILKLKIERHKAEIGIIDKRLEEYNGYLCKFRDEKSKEERYVQKLERSVDALSI